MKNLTSIQFMTSILTMIAVTTLAQSSDSNQTPQPEVRKIWDVGEHNAFTDLIRWRDRWWCTFREAEGHVGGDGKVRVITSADGQEWKSAALVAEKDIDLRDPKCSITPDDRLMIVCGGSVYLGTKQLKGRQPRVMFSVDGSTWTTPQKVVGEGEWLWRVTWYNGKAYGAAYKAVPNDNTREWNLNLYSSSDGQKWELVSPMEVSGKPNETTLRFLGNGDLMAMVRREGGNHMGWVGVAHPPYKQWTWHENNYQFGGPNFIQLSDGSFIAGTRDYTRKPQYSTLIAHMTPDTLLPIVTLPSGGDTSYPGLVWYDGMLWVSYYSSHEGKTSVYLAKIKMPFNCAK
jgi:hypothetical protein